MPQIPGYQITEQVYLGSRTAIYRGIREVDQKPVALKLLHDPYPTFNELVQFRNQYTLAKNLDLPGIITPYSLETYEHSYVLIMEDFGGISLKEWMQEWGTQGMGETPSGIKSFLQISIALCDILQGLYQNRVIHKDIKPTNILINRHTKEIKLIDFSISTLLPKETQQVQNPNILEGTLDYISPEQTGRMNRGIDYRSDFYSLGVTLFELLTGRLPFIANDPIELIHCHIAKNPPHVAEIIPEIPPVLGDIIKKLMAKNAEDRYQSSIKLKQDFETCLNYLETIGKIIFFPIAINDINDRLLIPEKLYGRESEVNILLETFDRVAKGTTELILVAGFSGIGKTSIINEIHKPIVKKRGYFIKGKFDQFNRNIPLSAFIQAFRDLTQQILTESNRELGIWQNKLLEVLGQNAQIIAEVIPEIQQIIGPQSPPPELSGIAAQNRFNLTFQKFINIFSTQDHPLVIFLDDWQWADAASLKLMQLLIGESNTEYLLLIGAYRDNEVNNEHPLLLTLDELSKSNIKIQTITLKPLTLCNLNQLLADTLSFSLEVAYPITELIYEKTQGNPFFSIQFLKSWYQNQSISFNHYFGQWDCDIDLIKNRYLTNSVVELIANQLRKLPTETQKVLQLAACIGNQFDLKTLAIISQQSQHEVAVFLWLALKEGLVIPETDVYKFFQSDLKYQNNHSSIPQVNYKFLHDRVQQAAYSLIPSYQKQKTHFQIGKLLWENTAENQQEELIFEIVNQLNCGVDLPISSEEKEHIARLNLLASRRAKISTAYVAAAKYASIGIKLLGENSWEQQYELTMDLYREQAETEQLNSNFEAAEILVKEAINRAKLDIEKADLYNFLVVQYTLEAKYDQAIAVGIQGLELLGFNIKNTDLLLAVHQEIAEIDEKLCHKEIASIVNNPRMILPDKKVAIKLLINLDPPSYIISNFELYKLLTVKAVNLSLAYGNAPESIKAYSNYGLIQGTVFGNYQTGYEFGLMARNLSDILPNLGQKCKNCLLLGNWIHNWRKPLKDAAKINREGYQAGLESGEFQFAGYNLFGMVCNLLSEGKELLEILEEINSWLPFTEKTKNNLATETLLAVKFAISDLIQSDIDPLEITFLNTAKNHNSSLALGIYYVYKCQSAYILNQFDSALDYAGESAKYTPAIFGLIAYADQNFYTSLSLLANLVNCDQKTQKIYWKKVENYQHEMEKWAQNCPANFQHKYFLIEAEKAKINQNVLQAIDYYDQAITAAKENGYTHEAALAKELAGKFYYEWGKEKIAQTYLIEAYYGYLYWGAKLKLDDLIKRYSTLLQPVLQQNQFQYRHQQTINNIFSPDPPSQSTLSNTPSVSDALDLRTILKATQTISQEIHLPQLVSKLTQILLESSGGKKCVLILHKDEQWVIEAITIINDAKDQNIICQSLPLENSKDVPFSMINYVKNTSNILVIDQFERATQWLSDPYFQKSDHQSILCLPILNQGKMIGIVYLENSLTAGVFTSDRIEILNILCSQAAISLENARLYQENQKAMKGLQQAQLQLVQNEKMSALGNLVAGVAHEINNPVSFIAGNVSIAREYVENLFHLIDLYEQHFPDPGPEITKEKESIELDYLREDLPQLIDSMQHGTERIHHISKSLRIFSRNDSDRLQAFDIHEGIDSALLILKHRLKATENRPSIEIIKDYGELPLVPCYPGQLNQVFMNIIANAIDALEDKSENYTFAQIKSAPNQVTIQTKVIKDKNRVLITILDNGVGMTPEVKRQVFDHLFTTKPAGKGTGLGLAIAQQIIIEKHHGSLDCDSTPGEGTKFLIELPL